METLHVDELKSLPEYGLVYTDCISEDLIESIRKKGVIEPLLVTRDRFILSGHQRRHAAQRAGLERVPVLYVECDDDLDRMELLIHSNKHRKKTRDIVAQEAARLIKIEQERAMRRMKEGGARGGKASGASRRGESKGVKDLSHPSEEGKSRDKVGEALGVSGPIAQDLAEVGEELNKARQAGDTQREELLRETVRRSLPAAVRLIEQEGAGAAPAVIRTLKQAVKTEEPQARKPKMELFLVEVTIKRKQRFTVRAFNDEDAKQRAAEKARVKDKDWWDTRIVYGAMSRSKEGTDE